MRGPVVFLGSLAAVTILAFCFFLPLHRERVELSIEVLERARITGAGRPATTPPQLERLASALGDGLDDAEAVRAIRAAALEFSPIDVIEVDGPAVRFPVAWDDVPRLLAHLARREGLVLRSFSAEPGEAPDRCLIQVEIEPRGNGNGAR